MPPTPITACRSCGHPDLEPLLDLGAQYPVDFPTTPEGMTHPASPVRLARCPQCTLVQLLDTVPRAWCYTNYWYRSGTNETMQAELRDIVASIRARISVTARSTVLDIGANDGTLLAAWLDTAVVDCPYRVAIEPAENMQAPLAPHADVVYPTTWPMPALPSGSITAITSIAMLYGTDDLNGFLAEVRRVLKPTGLWVVQFQDLASGLTTTAVDYLVHEHLMWFSATSLLYALDQHGLQLLDVEWRAINGGSLRCYVGRRGVPTPRVTEQLFREAEQGLNGDCWAAFLTRVALVRDAVPATISRVIDAGGTVDLYACSTKASLLLQLCGLRHPVIRQGVERQPEKVGRYIGATGIPIVSEAAWRQDPSDLTLVGAYQFKTAFLEREAAYRGAWLIPIPTPTLVYGRAGAAEQVVGG